MLLCISDVHGDYCSLSVKYKFKRVSAMTTSCYSLIAKHKYDSSSQLLVNLLRTLGNSQEATVACCFHFLSDQDHFLTPLVLPKMLNWQQFLKVHLSCRLLPDFHLVTFIAP